ncbi:MULTISPECIES: hypothetical protein [unclassified Microcoleus]|nr:MULTISPECIES: hypothetical protein [unclassified Microcoleus]
MQNRQLLQHKFSVMGQICQIVVATDALQAIANRFKSRYLTKLVSREAKL